jgi:hypothetical protein
LGQNIKPAAVADKAKFIYYYREVDYVQSLWVQRGTNEARREKLGDGAVARAFNRDLSQVVVHFNNRSWIVRNGAPRPSESLTGNFSGLVLPHNTAVFGNIYGISGFANTFHTDGDRVNRIENNFTSTPVTSRQVQNVYLAKDGQTLTFLRGNRIMRTNGKGVDPQATAVELVSDVSSFHATADGKAVFFVNRDGDIRYQKGAGVPSLVENDYGNAGMALFKGDTLFYLRDRELYTSSGGRRGTKVGGLKGDVMGLAAGHFDIAVAAWDGIDEFRYRSTDGKRFDLIYQE